MFPNLVMLTLKCIQHTSALRRITHWPLLQHISRRVSTSGREHYISHPRLGRLRHHDTTRMPLAHEIIRT